VSGMVELAFRARGIPIESAASIPITHCTPFNQHRLLRCQYLLASLMHVHDFAHDLNLIDRLAVRAAVHPGDGVASVSDASARGVIDLGLMLADFAATTVASIATWCSRPIRGKETASLS